MRLRRLALLAALLVPLALLAGSAGATSSQICGNQGSGYCLNDWGGHDVAGNPVKMYYGGYGNENFFNYPLVNMCGSGLVTATCPGLGAAQSSYIGQPIYEIAYGPGGCISDNGTGGVVLGTCPDSYGNGGSSGTIYVRVQYAPGSCIYINRLWTAYYGTGAGLQSGGNIGVQATDNYTGTLTDWGGTGTGC